jgi:hypothetical protein
VAADRDDEPGVLGNLPRSRPGRRSDKRSTGSTARKKPTTAKPTPKARASATSQRAKRTTGGRAAARSSSSAKTAAPSQRPAARREETAASSSGGGSDPISTAVRLAGKVAETGVKTAVGIIKRLPGAPR